MNYILYPREQLLNYHKVNVDFDVVGWFLYLFLSRYAENLDLTVENLHNLIHFLVVK